MKPRSITSQDIKEFLIENKDIDFVGIAPVERFLGAPPTKHPNDLLSEGRRVISIGTRQLNGVIRANDLAWAGNRHAIFSYMLYGYANMNWMLAQAAFSISRLLEKNGFIAMPIPTSPPNDSENNVGMMSNRHAAVAAGLGDIGWNSLLITPQTAGRLRLVSVITDAELEPDPLYEGERICDAEKCGYLCAKACPVGAISTTKPVELTIGGRVHRHGLIDKWRCRSRLGVKGPWRPPVGDPPPLPKEITPQVWREYQKYQNPWDAAEAAPIGRGDRCGQCIMVCPVARRDAKPPVAPVP
ncbi:MAG: hypothetical protein HYY30_14255 [Chloroflexi bacterium]|nr:hypothetical protein [Chloroflexota bacterium]